MPGPSDPPETEAALALEEAEVRLIYAESGCVMLAFHGPDQNIVMGIEQKDG